MSLSNLFSSSANWFSHLYVATIAAAIVAFQICTYHLLNNGLSLPHHLHAQSAGAWNRQASLLFVDQPIGTGFSKTGKILLEVNGCVNHCLVFLRQDMRSRTAQNMSLFTLFLKFGSDE